MNWLILDIFHAFLDGWLMVGKIHYAHGVPWYNVIRVG
jgi:hypothetical protein